MCQGKGSFPHSARERVVVPVPGCSALGGHSGMSHHRDRVIPDPDLELVAWNGPLMDAELLPHVVGNPGGVRPPGLALRGQDMQELGFLLPREGMPGVDQSK